MPSPRTVTGDLLDQDVDALVNAWNRNLLPWWLLLPTGTAGALLRRAGRAPFRELARMPMIPLGSAVLTGAGDLPHRALIHVAGIDLLWRASEASIRDSVRSALALAEAQGFASIAFPLIGAGTGGFSADASERLMRDTVEGSDTAVDVVLVRHPGS